MVTSLSTAGFAEEEEVVAKRSPVAASTTSFTTYALAGCTPQESAPAQPIEIKASSGAPCAAIEQARSAASFPIPAQTATHCEPLMLPCQAAPPLRGRPKAIGFHPCTSGFNSPGIA